MLFPAKPKYRKAHKGRVKGLAYSGDKLSFGCYGFSSAVPGRINSRQIEAARRVMMRYLKRNGKLWIRVFPDIPISKKPAEVRMGSGKGNPEFWACRVYPGTMIFELSGISEADAKEAFRKAAAKLPVQHKFVSMVLYDKKED